MKGGSRYQVSLDNSVIEQNNNSSFVINMHTDIIESNIAIINCDLLNDKIPCSDFLTDLTGLFLLVIMYIHGYENIYN
jgi:hypothetical protein